jgi:hypothetical protein
VKGGVIVVGVKNNELSFDVKKGKKGSLIGEEFFGGMSRSRKEEISK